MSKKRDAAWERFQIWLRLSKRPAFKADTDIAAFDKTIVRAASAFGLNAKKSTDLHLLLGIFAHILFPPRPNEGALKQVRKKSWSPARVAQLKKDADKIMRARREEKISLDELARQMLEIWPKHFVFGKTAAGNDASFTREAIKTALKRHWRGAK